MRHKPGQSTFFDQFETGIYKPEPAAEIKPPPSSGLTTTTRTTSDQAAQEARPIAASVREQVLEWIRSQGAKGSTDEECQLALNMNPSTQRPRRVELWRSGLIVGNGTRPTRSGRSAAVWVVLNE